MYCVGITQTKLLPPLLYQPKGYAHLDRKNKFRVVAMGGGYRRPPFTGRFAAALYRAHQCKNGKWIWKRTDVIGETRTLLRNAILDAHQLAEICGQCQVKTYGLGGVGIA